MKFTLFKIQRSQVIMVATLALAIGAGNMQAAGLIAVGSPTLTLPACSPFTGLASATATITVTASPALLGSNTVTVALPSPLPPGLLVTAPAGQVLSTSVLSLTYTVTLPTTTNCIGYVGSVQPTINFKSGLLTAVPTAEPSGVIVTTTSPTAGPYLATISPVTIGCSSLTGPGFANVVVKPSTALTGTTTLTVSIPTPIIGLTVTAPATQVLNLANQTAGLTYKVALPTAANCNSFAYATPSFAFKVASGTGTAVAEPAASVSVTATAPLVVTPSSVNVYCTWNGSAYSQLTPQTVLVTSVASGVPVTATAPLPSTGVSITPTTLQHTGATAVSLSIAPLSGCGGLTANKTTSIHLVSAGSADTLIPVTLQIVKPSALTVTSVPASGSMTYNKGSGTPGSVDINVTASPSAQFLSVDTSSLPPWLNVDSTTGTAGITIGTGKKIRFSSTTVADSLAPGIYTATAVLNVTGYAAYKVPISLQVNNQIPKLTIVEGVTRNFTWQVGQVVPSLFVTLTSSDSPISYSLATGGTLAPVIAASQQSGLAYNFGTAIPVTFNPLVFAAATPGSVLTGVVTITWGPSNSTSVITFNATILSPQATFTSISPAGLPLATAGQTFTLGLTGSGFVPSTDPLLKTKVGVVVGSTLQTDTNFSVNVLNSSNIALTITVPATADPYLPFSTGAVSVTIGVCNPNGTSCATATGTQVIGIGITPNIVALTSASTFIQATTPTIAPFDLISIFGTNFCSPCTSTQVLTGVVNSNLVYPTVLSPDLPSVASPRNLTVSFYTHTGTATLGTLLGTAPLLFATNNQINLIVPSTVTAGSQADVVVSFGTVAAPTSSAIYTVNVAATDPGIFTVGSDGTGSGAILNTAYATITQSNPTGLRTGVGGGTSDVVHIYMTGLGAPDTGADNASAGTVLGPVWKTDCISFSSYLASLGAQTGVTPSLVDGTVIQSILFNTNRLPPCVGTTNVVTAYVGSSSILTPTNAAVVTYAGWVPDSIAGLYQVDVQLPLNTGTFTNAAGVALTGITSADQLPIMVYVNGTTVHSQANVNIWVAPRLAMTGPGLSGLSTTVGTLVSATSLVAATATGGLAPYLYTVTSGLLPSGLSLVTASGIGYIQGTPAANTAGTYLVTVTATDSSIFPVSGTWTFTLTVNGGLVVNVGSLINTPFGTGATTTLTAAGGAYPYTYSITTPGSTPPGMALSIPTTSVLFSVSTATPAGTYNVVVTATDSATPSVTGIASFTEIVSLLMSNSTPLGAVTAASATPTTVTTVATLGQSGTIAYTLDAASGTAGFTIASTGVITATSVPSGTHNLIVTATDSAPATGATGNATKTLPITVSVP